jgi:Protein of unknown function (DUF3047)
MAFFFSSCKLRVMLFQNVFTRYSWLAVVFCLFLGLSGCSTVEPAIPVAVRADASSAGLDAMASNWQPMALPGKRKTQFNRATHEGRVALRAVSQGSASLLRKKVHIAAADLGALHFSWQVPMLIESADMAERDTEDAVVRVILTFEGDRSKFSHKNRMLSDLSHALTGEEMPYATLMYVWCNKRAVGSVITNPRTDRIRKLVVETGKPNLSKWLDYERDIRADFMQAFGEQPGALMGIALMTDTDNTQSKATAWYGPVNHKAGKKVATTVP